MARPSAPITIGAKSPGWRAMTALKQRVGNALRQQTEDRLCGDREAIALLFEWSMVEFVERYLDDERLHEALLGQGVIGTNANNPNVTR